VDKIPLAHSGPKNPVAHDSPSEAPEAPPQGREGKEVTPPDRSAELHNEKKKARRKKRACGNICLHSTSWKKISCTVKRSSSFESSVQPLPGSAAWHGQHQRWNPIRGLCAADSGLIARNWNTGDVIARTAPSVIATFDLMKDGSIRNSAILQGSGVRFSRFFGTQSD